MMDFIRLRTRKGVVGPLCDFKIFEFFYFPYDPTDQSSFPSSFPVIGYGWIADRVSHTYIYIYMYEIKSTIMLN